MKQKRNVTSERIYERGMREPRLGELTYELKRIITKHCTNKPFKEAMKSVTLATARVARAYGVAEYSCDYDRTTFSSAHPWIDESISIRMYRRQSNGTLAIYRAGAISMPRASTKNQNCVVLGKVRSVHIFYGVDDPYDWENSCRKPYAKLVAKWKRNGHSLKWLKKRR